MWCILGNQLPQALWLQQVKTLKAQGKRLTQKAVNLIRVTSVKWHSLVTNLQQNTQYLSPVWGYLGYCSTGQHFTCILSIFLQTISATDSFKNVLEVLLLYITFLENEVIHLAHHAGSNNALWCTSHCSSVVGVTAAISWASHWEGNTEGTKMVHALAFF